MLLWIDFKLYFYVRIHKFAELNDGTRWVVNWFQIVFLREDSQVNKHTIWRRFRCELISNCIFTWGFTSQPKQKTLTTSLWIDFKLYFYVRIHKSKHKRTLHRSVVNWFQIVFLREDSQVLIVKGIGWLRCELISNCIFTWGFTSLKYLRKTGS